VAAVTDRPTAAPRTRPLGRTTVLKTSGQLLGDVLLWAWTIATLIFLVAPLLVIVPLSFNQGSFLSFPMPGWSLRWYQELWNTPIWWQSFKHSLIVGAGATAIATVLGTLAAVGLSMATFRGKTFLMALLISPLIVPLIIVAAGTYFYFVPLGLANSLLGLTLVHAALGAPFVLITVSATLVGFDRNLARAGASLGAPPLLVFAKITMPLIAPGMIAGALFAFITSFDELVVAMFLTGPGQRTLPRQMFDGIRENLSPTILAVATLLILFSVALLTTMELLRRRNVKMRGIRE
jgi:putative spermidine/putrescine transport system permease protein